MDLPPGDTVVWGTGYQTHQWSKTPAQRQAARNAEAAIFKKRGAFRFLDLSPELRTAVYKYALTGRYIIQCTRQYKDMKKRQEGENISFVGVAGDYTVGLLYACKRVYEEAVPIALSQNIIQLSSIKLALKIMRHYGMDKQNRKYSVKINQSVHSSYDSISVTEPLEEDDNSSSITNLRPETGSPPLLQLIEFCKANPHNQVELTFEDIYPDDLPYVGQADEPDSVRWYNFLLEHQPEVPSSLKVKFHLDPEEWEDIEEPSHLRYEPKLRVWGAEAVHWPWRARKRARNGYDTSSDEEWMADPDRFNEEQVWYTSDED